MTGGKQGLEVEVALQWTAAYAENVVSFVNNINTIDGGTHVSGLKLHSLESSTATFLQTTWGKGSKPLSVETTFEKG